MRTDTSAVDVEGTVEYKSLPSGLHNIQEDLVYVASPPHAQLAKRQVFRPRAICRHQRIRQPSRRRVRAQCEDVRHWRLGTLELWETRQELETRAKAKGIGQVCPQPIPLSQLTQSDNTHRTWTTCARYPTTGMHIRFEVQMLPLRLTPRSIPLSAYGSNRTANARTNHCAIGHSATLWCWKRLGRP